MTGIGAVLNADIGHPVRADPAGHRGKHIGTIEIPPRRVEGNLLLLEVEALAEDKAELLLSATGIDQPAR